MKIKIALVLFLVSSITYGQSEKSKPFVLGLTEVISSSILGESRTLNIYLPEGYSAKDSIAYPVVYLLDGGADEDFIHIVGLYQFNSFSWIKQVPPSIIVGIANVDRRRDFTFPSTVEKDSKAFPTTGKSGQFISFLQQELQPFINKQFKTTADKTIIGESLGGLLAAEILLKDPALFNRYIIVSPSLWWDDGSLLNWPDETLKKKHLVNTAVYIGSGKEGVYFSKSPHVTEVDANLLADKLNMANLKDFSVHFDYLPNENHATVMHQAVFNALKSLYHKEE